MPKEYFKLGDTTSIKDLKANSKIHVVGVCGVAMAQLAVLLTKKGFSVSGSDKEFYEPMAGLLASSSVKTFQGFKAENIPDKVDLVVIGNAISYGNPEVSAVETKKLPYTCFPQILAEVVIADKHSIVVSGTHGKSTTSAMIASMLAKLNLDPSYFIGGITGDLPLSLHSGDGKHCVVEGDEYDSAFFAKVPKFSFYKPQICIINAIEFDHADIYPNLDAINAEFTKMVNSLPATGKVVCCIDYDNVRILLAKWQQSAKCQFITFGENPAADYKISGFEAMGLGQKISIKQSNGNEFEFQIPLPGVFNAKNALVALISAEILGIDRKLAANALQSFKGVKRRQEVRYQDQKNILIEDFAHHPTAVKETINAIRLSFPNHKITAIFEPRSNTSRRKVFQQEYIEAFKNANQVILSNVEAREIDQGQELLDIKTLSDSIASSGVPSTCLENAKAIEDYAIKNLMDNELLLVMSNGSFGGLIANLEGRLKAH